MIRVKIMGCPCTKKIICYRSYSIVHKLSNKQSAKVICRFDRLKAAHIKRQKAIYEWILEKRPYCHMGLFHVISPANGYTCTLHIHSPIAGLG